MKSLYRTLPWFLLAVLALSASAFAKPAPLVLNGIAKLEGCSGSLIRWAASPNRPAIVLTNGHCIDLIKPGTFRVNQPWRDAVALFDRANRPYPVRGTRLLYATMTGTDIALIELDTTYAELATRGIDAFSLSREPAPVGTPILLTSGYFKTSVSCTIDAIVPFLREDEWNFKQSYKYTDCKSDHGTSGSPLIAAGSRVVIGVNNTGNDNGERCTFNNPCEIDEQGRVNVVRGMNYGQQTYPIHACLNPNGEFDLQVPGCALPGSARWRAYRVIR